MLDNLSIGHRQAVEANRLVVGDLSDAALVNQLLAERQIVAVVHFAAFADVGESVTDPAKYYANNLLNSLALLEACRHKSVSTAFARGLSSWHNSR